ncbi:MAG: hypothetical protein WB587_11670 [Nitrososphaeraceae archaeon]
MSEIGEAVPKCFISIEYSKDITLHTSLTVYLIQYYYYGPFSEYLAAILKGT